MISRYSITILTLEGLFAALWLNGEFYISGTILLTIAAFLGFNLVGARAWGSKEIWHYSVRSAVLVSILFVMYGQLLPFEFPLLSIITPAMIVIGVVAVSVVYALVRDPFSSTGRLGAAKKSIWKAER